MKLLFDQNLSFRLVSHLSKWYPDSIHVKDLAMQTATDSQIWTYAKQRGLIIVSKDSDFHQRSFFHGAPPKVIWIEKGNCSTKEIIMILKDSTDKIADFASDSDSSFLVL